MAADYIVQGKNKDALFTLKIYRGEGMALLAMNWKKGKPSRDFVGFAIEYQEPGGTKFYQLKNRLAFPGLDGDVNPNKLSTRLSPIQKFRWVHFPRNADMAGEFVYRVTPVFMNSYGELSYGDFQEAAIELRGETYFGKMNVAFTRGFVSSQAFVDRYESQGPLSTLLPDNADAGLSFAPTHPAAQDALAWMGFEARAAIFKVLDDAIADKQAEVRVVAYDLNEPEIVSRLEKLGSRLRIMIDNDGSHGEAGSAENTAEQRLSASAGSTNVRRQHMGKLQHNKTIVVKGQKVKTVVCGSTNFSWRGLYVQANNAVILSSAKAVDVFMTAFDNYWNYGSPSGFGSTASAEWTTLGLSGISASVALSPHSAGNALLSSVAHDISSTTSSLLYSLAFLYQTPGDVQDAIKNVSKNNTMFVYGISDRKVGGIDLQKPDANISPVYPAALSENLPEPFKSEPKGGSGNRMHHKFVVIDFDKPTARVYLGSYNFSETADRKNGENLLLVKERRVAVAYMIEALRLIDHYHFRVSQQEAKKTKKRLQLVKPPRKPGEKPWWDEDYRDVRKIRDRELFA